MPRRRTYGAEWAKTIRHLFSCATVVVVAVIEPAVPIVGLILIYAAWEKATQNTSEPIAPPAA